MLTILLNKMKAQPLKIWSLHHQFRTIKNQHNKFKILILEDKMK